MNICNILADVSMLSSSRAVKAAGTELRPGISSLSWGLNDSFLDSPPGTCLCGVKECRGGEWVGGGSPAPPLAGLTLTPAAAMCHRFPLPLPPCITPISPLPLSASRCRRRLNDFLSQSRNVDFIWMEGENPASRPRRLPVV